MKEHRGYDPIESCFKDLEQCSKEYDKLFEQGTLTSDLTRPGITGSEIRRKGTHSLELRCVVPLQYALPSTLTAPGRLARREHHRRSTDAAGLLHAT